MSGVPAEQFVSAYLRAWEQKETLQDLAATLNMSLQNVCSRRDALRRKTINLPQLRRGRLTRERVDYNHLRQVVEAFKKERGLE